MHVVTLGSRQVTSTIVRRGGEGVQKSPYGDHVHVVTLGSRQVTSTYSEEGRRGSSEESLWRPCACGDTGVQTGY